MRMSMEVRGIKPLTGKSAEARKELGNTRAVHKIMGLRVLKWVDDNFREEGKERPWRRMAESTSYARRAGGGRILQVTGRLRQSFTMAATQKDVRVGTSIPYALYHHEGTRTYPIRPRQATTLAFIHPAGRAVGGGKRMMFRREVQHPGLPKRALLPSKKVATDITRQVTEAWRDKVLKEARL